MKNRLSLKDGVYIKTPSFVFNYFRSDADIQRLNNSVSHSFNSFARSFLIFQLSDLSARQHELLTEKAYYSQQQEKAVERLNIATQRYFNGYKINLDEISKGVYEGVVASFTPDEKRIYNAVFSILKRLDGINYALKHNAYSKHYIVTLIKKDAYKHLITPKNRRDIAYFYAIALKKRRQDYYTNPTASRIYEILLNSDAELKTQFNALKTELSDEKAINTALNDAFKVVLNIPIY